MSIVLVIADSTDLRVAEFAKIFAGLGHELILVAQDGKVWAKVKTNGICEPPLAPDDRPSSATVLLVHRSDLKEAIDQLETQLKHSWRKAFIFNAPGNPLPTDGFLPILRKTNDFQITKKHAQEICDYASDDKGLAPLPSCCCYESARHHLIALDILCQGYLVARNRADLLDFEAKQFPILRSLPEAIRTIVAASEWWLQPFDGINPRETVATECGGVVPTELQKLLDKPGGEGEEAERRVGKAHSKIREILMQ